MKIVVVPENVLHKKAKPVTDFGPKLSNTVEDMRRTLEACVDPVGVGLAAPQVGISQRIFLMKPTAQSETRTFVNPRIIARKKTLRSRKSAKDTDGQPLEGCLSIPRIWGPISRDHEVTLKWQDIHGNTHQDIFSGFEAAIIQHEIDHLDGILFTLRLAEQKAPIYEERNNKLHELL